MVQRKRFGGTIAKISMKFSPTASSEETKQVALMVLKFPSTSRSCSTVLKLQMNLPMRASFRSKFTGMLEFHRKHVYK